MKRPTGKQPLRTLTVQGVTDLCNDLEIAIGKASDIRHDANSDSNQMARADHARWHLEMAIHQTIEVLRKHTEEAAARHVEWYEGTATAHAAADRSKGGPWVCRCGACRIARNNGFEPSAEPAKDGDSGSNAAQLFERGRQIVKSGRA